MSTSIHDINFICCHRSNITHAGITVSEHGAFPLGSEVSISCFSDFGVTTIDWLLDGRVIHTAVASEGELSISEVTENHHDRMYTCRATAPFGVQEHTISLQVEGMHPLSKQKIGHYNNISEALDA